ncbi:dioxygenase family protein [Nocardia stercoris]|uniref:Dioxygenase n=1 Tax=Nocardia stercoris TaxID=2483361 RepID=A0A3M2LBH0_9NOCA|nr:class III extradiol ring-cleavage dioxygenase [Nocardia stercoris]RMI33295.1 dioxygenase [Nocardia stercoris]
MATTTDRMPVIYLSHGAPPLADDPIWPGQLAAWSADLPRPTAILMISAHWEAAPITVGATETVPLVYDFGGFAPHYYRVTYPAPGAPELAAKVAALLGGPHGAVRQEPERGLDHGAYVPLAEMYPDADIPVLQLSMPTLAPAELAALGQRLAPLRDEGVLIVGSGFFTHNLRAIRAGDRRLAQALTEFDDWGSRALDAGDLDSLLNFEHAAPAARLAHPRTEHFAPLFVTLGAGLDDLGTQRSVIDGEWLGLSKRSIQIG